MAVLVLGWGVGGRGEGERAPVAALHRTLDAPVCVIVPERAGAGGEDAFCSRRHRGGRCAQVSEDTVVISQVALVCPPLPHGEGAGSTRERDRASGRSKPQHPGTSSEHHGDPEIALYFLPRGEKTIEPYTWNRELPSTSREGSKPAALRRDCQVLLPFPKNRSCCLFGPQRAGEPCWLEPRWLGCWSSATRQWTLPTTQSCVNSALRHWSRPPSNLTVTTCRTTMVPAIHGWAFPPRTRKR